MIVEYKYQEYKLIRVTSLGYMFESLYINDKQVLTMHFSMNQLEGYNTGMPIFYNIKNTSDCFYFYLILSNEKLILPNKILNILEDRWITHPSPSSVPPKNWKSRILSTF